ncbi:VOC family protein [Lentzea sp. NBC_00516]|uniref:VOC family protein n=1 Tax=Lentzea sp. NBC_00516 TaxID=2903582 RepID=UPI002E8136F4|nr:VOC family protein [Lentzea sp. NBC_00516]WUD22632.1 VOC family protein [Lentzea sp. NBC_00516]
MKLSHTFLFVHDQDAALKFYRDVIGLDVRSDESVEDYRWLTVGPAGQPDVEIGLSRIGPPVPPTDHEALHALLAKGSLHGVIFVVDDVDAKFEQVRAAGAEVMQEPVDQFYGVRDCAFRDPSGNMIRFSTPRSVQP